MDEDTCHDVFAKLTKPERFQAIEMLVKNFNSFDEVDIFVSELDLHLSQQATTCTADIVDKNEVHDIVGDGKAGLEKHIRVHTGEKPYHCSFCPKTFSRISHLKSHRKLVHEKENELNTFSEKSLRSPMREKKLFICEECNKHLTSEGNYNQHMKRYHDDQKEKELFDCKRCNKTFNTKGAFYIHNKRVHEESERFICDVCSRPCGSKADLERHRRVHTGEKPFTCSICPKTFKQNSKLRKHRQSVHKEETEDMSPPKKLFPCEKCDKKLTSKWIYKCHMKRYHDDQKEKELLSCKKCNKEFISKARLYTHNKRVHEENGRFICDVCSKPWASKADLERHRRIHTGEKPYTCSICPKTFNRISILKRHTRIHTGEKPYTCSICPKTFNRISILNSHKEVFHKGEQ